MYYEVLLIKSGEKNYLATIIGVGGHMLPFILQLIKIPGVTLGVEEVPVGQDRFVRVPHNHHTSSLERADVILEDNIESCGNLRRIYY